MKVAFATITGNQIDEHFGRAGQFAVYDITPDGAELLELRKVADGDLDTEVVVTRGMGAAHDDALGTKIDKLADAKIVYFTEIGGPSAAKLVRRRHHAAQGRARHLHHRRGRPARRPPCATDPPPGCAARWPTRTCDGPADAADPDGPCSCESAGKGCCC